MTNALLIYNEALQLYDDGRFTKCWVFCELNKIEALLQLENPDLPDDQISLYKEIIMYLSKPVFYQISDYFIAENL